MGKKRKHTENEQDRKDYDLPAKHMNTSHIRSNERRLIIILERAQLETVKVGQLKHITSWSSLSLTKSMSTSRLVRYSNCWTVTTTCRYWRRMAEIPAPVDQISPISPCWCWWIRPWIVPDCYKFTLKPKRTSWSKSIPRLVFLGPSDDLPDWWVEKLKVIFWLKTILIDLIPISVQLLHKFSIKASDSPQKLMRVIKNPISDHLPVGCRKYAMSFSASEVKHARELVPKVDEPVALVVGAFAHGALNLDYTEGNFSISNYPLSAALACTKICSAFEEVWGII